METVQFSFNGCSPIPQIVRVLGYRLTQQTASYLATDILTHNIYKCKHRSFRPRAYRPLKGKRACNSSISAYRSKIQRCKQDIPYLSFLSPRERAGTCSISTYIYGFTYANPCTCTVRRLAHDCSGVALTWHVCSTFRPGLNFALVQRYMPSFPLGVYTPLFRLCNLDWKLFTWVISYIVTVLGQSVSHPQSGMLV